MSSCISITSARTIDVHAHVVLEETMGAAGDHGPELKAGADDIPVFRVGRYELCGVRYRDSPFMDVQKRMSAMDDAGIDFQVLSPNPLTYLHHIDAVSAARFCRRHNNALARLVTRHSARLAGLAALPMQAPNAALEELTRAVTELGLWGACVGTEFGIRLDSPQLDPLYRRFVALNVPLFLHPAPAGIDGPEGFPAMGHFDLDLLIGFAAQETVAVATLIYGGVLDRHPDLDICISHGGGAIALLAGRCARAARKRPWASQGLRGEGAFEERLRRLWFDNHLHDERAVALLESHVGRHRIVLGTNFAGWDQPDGGDLRMASAQLAANARKLLRQDTQSAPG